METYKASKFLDPSLGVLVRSYEGPAVLRPDGSGADAS
jgi:hypothetical protein